MTHYDPELMAETPDKPTLKAGDRAAMGTIGEGTLGRILHTHDGKAWFQPDDTRYPSFLVDIPNLKPIPGLSPKHRLFVRLADGLTGYANQPHNTAIELISRGFVDRQYLREIGEQGE